VAVFDRTRDVHWGVKVGKLRSSSPIPGPPAITEAVNGTLPNGDGPAGSPNGLPLARVMTAVPENVALPVPVTLADVTVASTVINAGMRHSKWPLPS